ncbi:MAG TPA: 3'-5' exonuclease [Burkholderiaceae bacterium]|nr:3'-5' exonuclease [Burkholderiaceae bacterium]
MGAVDAVRRRWLLYHLADPDFAFMYDTPPPDEWVTIDCETTGLDTRRDQIVSVAAVRIVGNRLLTSQRLELLVRPERKLKDASVRVHQLREQDLAHGLDPEQAMRRLLAFIGARPLVGYYLEFDVAMLNREIWPLLGVRLPQPMIEVSSMYYDWKNQQLPPHERGGTIDLRFATMMNTLDLPTRDAHDALNDAVMAGLAFVKLRALAAAR